MGKSKKPKKRSAGSRSPPVRSSSSPVPHDSPSDEVCTLSAPGLPSSSSHPKNASAVVQGTGSSIVVDPVVSHPDLVQICADSSPLVPSDSQVLPAPATLPVNASATVITTSSAIVRNLEVGSPILGQTPVVDLIQVDSVSDPLSVSNGGEVSKEEKVPTVPIVPVVPSAGDSWVNLFSGPSTRSLSKKGNGARKPSTAKASAPLPAAGSVPQKSLAKLPLLKVGSSKQIYVVKEKPHSQPEGSKYALSPGGSANPLDKGKGKVDELSGKELVSEAEADSSDAPSSEEVDDDYESEEEHEYLEVVSKRDRRNSRGMAPKFQ
ncbi:unnamed protein product [Arabidopsis arenosa]|uniref:Uncharacterized protein n=1 Tax=Arabidopsis arenosa TaxID=38785 RepID=A0A8S2A6J2_ARAAE|nr:unnamed protein product [Arabidopsis arenosa]